MKNSVILIILLIFSSTVYASRSKTVGELLNSIDQKGANKALAERQKALIPKVKAVEAIRPKNLSSVRPIRTREIIKNDRETAELESVIDESIDQLFKLTQKYKNSPNRGELWLRLGELYVEKAKLIEFRSYEEYDKQLSDFNDKKRKTRPRLNLKLAHDYNKKAIQLYEWFVRDYPKDRKIDQALFFLGYNYFQIGMTKKGADYYEDLNKKYPKSKFVSESNFSLGEYYFENEEWQKALTAYQKVIKDGDARLTSFAFYKSAWCNYRLGKVKTAIDQLTNVIRIGRRNSDQRIKLVAEAQRDLVSFYANHSHYKDAEAFLSRHIEASQMPGALERLGLLYLDTGSRDGARFILTNLINRNPTNEKALDLQFQVTDAYSTGGSRNIYMQELKSFIENYGPSSPWAKANPSQLAKSEDLREKYLHNHTLMNHQLYTKSRSEVAMNMAQAGYRLYLTHFMTGKNAAEIHFFYGELLFDQGKNKAAAKSYDWVVKNDSNSKYYANALNNALVALEKDLPPEDSIRKKVGNSVEPVEMPEEVRTFIAIAEDYKGRFQSKQRQIEIQFRIGRLYYLFNQFQQAEENFKFIVNTAPQSKEAGFATNLILDIYNLRQDYAGLATVGEELLSNPNLTSSPAMQEVRDVLERAAFKSAQDLEDSKDYLASAQAYYTFSQKYPKSSLIIPASFNAAVNFERSAKIMPALMMFSIVAKSNDSKYVKEKNNAYLSQANLLQSIGRYEEAAEIYETYANRNDKDPKRADLYYNAATLWDAINNDARAVRNYERYYQFTNNKKDRVEVFYRIAKIYEENKKYNFSSQYYKRYIGENKSDKVASARAKHDLAKLYQVMNDTGKAMYWYRDIIKNHARDGGRSVRFLAEARVQVANQNLENYEKIRFPEDPNQQARVLNQKISLLNSLTEEYKNIIKLNSGPQIIASLTALGRAYEHFAEAVEQAPKPKGLSPEELKQYSEGLSEVTNPKRKSAVEFYKDALKKSKELSIYDISTQYAYEALSVYGPDTYIWGKDFVIESPSVEVKSL